MATCLGLYIDRNIIKYAKVSKEKTSTKVDAFGVEMYSDLKQTIDKIIEETYSFKIPISVNLSDEVYNYFYMSNLLNKKDLGKAIKTEFESFCYEKKINSNALESKYILVNDVNEKDKIKVIHASVDKIKLNKIVADFEDKRVNTITPMPLSIANIAPIEAKTNAVIVNIEDTTTVTFITGEKVYDIKKINVGAGKILDEINEKENSYKKAYDICKNTTIYTMQGKDLQENESEYLSAIVPGLYQIATELDEMLNNTLVKINKAYITGTGSVINNIDLYFEEILTKVKCEILKPFFISDSPKINIKDYIEVNSAISLALQGLDIGIDNINFVSSKSAFPSWITMFSNSKGKKSGKGSFIQKINSINIPNMKLSKFVIALMTISIVLSASYSGISIFINNQIREKNSKLEENKNYTNKQISLVQKDVTSVNSKISEYNALIQNLQNASDNLTEKQSYKNVIPVLLSEITTVIPKEVQITSIENVSERKIVINAQSAKYEQLAYFKAKLKSEGILSPSSVVSSEAVKENNIVKIVIEGELP